MREPIVFRERRRQVHVGLCCIHKTKALSHGHFLVIARIIPMIVLGEGLRDDEDYVVEFAV